MKNHEKTVTAMVAGGLALFFLILGVSQGWPALVWLLLALLPIAGAFAADRTVQYRREQQRLRAEFVRMPSPPPQPEQPRQESLSDISLRSAVPDYRFLLSGTVYWRPVPGASINHGNPGALAREAVVRRAAELLASEHPDERGALSERLNAVAGSVQRVASGEIETWASEMVVTLPEADRERLYQLAEVRKAEEVWEHKRNHERNVREYLGEDVLQNPGRAIVWWLARHNNTADAGLDATVRNIGHLRTLTSAVHDTEIPPRQADPLGLPYEWPSPGTDMPEYRFHPSGMDGSAQLPLVVPGQSTSQDRDPATELLSFVDGLSDSDDRDLFARRLSRLLDTHDQHEAATTLRHHYELADNDEPPEHPSGEPERPDAGS